MNEHLKTLRKLETRQSELRQEAATLSGIQDLNDEQRQRLDDLGGDVADNERQLRAAKLAAETEDRESIVNDKTGEGDEFREIRGRVRVGAYVQAAMETRGIDGAEAELNAALKLPSGELPLELLAPETRATTNIDAAGTQAPWIDRLFAQTCAAHLGVSFRSVPPGTYNVPVIKQGGTAKQLGRTEAAGDAAWTAGVEQIKNTRNAVRMVFSSEDAYRLPGLEPELTTDMNMTVVEGIDRAIFLGDSGANEDRADITGLQTLATSTGITESTLTQAAKLLPSDTLAVFLALVDGKHASSLDDLRVVTSVGANTLWGGTVLVADTSETASVFKTMANFLNDNGVMWKTRGEIETATANGDFGAFIARTRNIEGAAVAPVWASAQLIRDPYTNAAKGEVALTLSTHWGLGFPRASHFARLKFVT